MIKSWNDINGAGAVLEDDSVSLKKRQGESEVSDIAADVLDVLEGASLDKRQTIGVSFSFFNDDIGSTSISFRSLQTIRS